MKKTRGNILICTIIYLIIFILLKKILNEFNLEYMQWIKYFSIIIITIGTIIGTIQILKKKKIILVILLIFETVIITFIVGILLLALVLNPEEVVYKNGKKMVKETRSVLLSNWINYYDYKNIFVRGKNKRIHESYNNSLNEYLDTIYFDEKGNRILNDDEKKKTNTEELKNNIVEEDIKQSETIKINDTIYEKIVDKNTIIRILYKGSILAQRSAISIEKTIDGGKTWNNQIKDYDGFMQIHNGAQFIFLDEMIGFINDPGLAGTNGENRNLLVTTDGGKTFKKANIIHPDNIIEESLLVDSVPYIEKGILKLDVYTINYNKNPIKTYYKFYSQDNGLNWEYSI